MKLDVNAAERSIEERIAQPLGYTGREGMIQMADGMISIATVIMAGAIRRISVEHGLDPRDFVLFSYGGGGPLHACALAHELSIPTVVIPPTAVTSRRSACCSPMPGSTRQKLFSPAQR